MRRNLRKFFHWNYSQFFIAILYGTGIAMWSERHYGIAMFLFCISGLWALCYWQVSDFLNSKWEALQKAKLKHVEKPRSEPKAKRHLVLRRGYWAWNCGVSGIVILIVLSTLGFMEYTREVSMGLIFKDAPEFTTWRRLVITHDLFECKTFLNALHINSPENLPPFSIGTNDVGESMLLPAYRGDMELGKQTYRNRMAATRAFIGYVVAQKYNESEAGKTEMLSKNAEFESVAMITLEGYLNSSYWGELDKLMPFPLLNVLWDVRSQLGADYTDRLVAYTLMLVVDSPKEDISPNASFQFWSKLKRADSVTESDATKWRTILEILKKHGEKTEGLEGPFL
jgi:hypothetical protein